MTKTNKRTTRKLTAGQKAARTKGRKGFAAAGIKAAMTRLKARRAETKSRNEKAELGAMIAQHQTTLAKLGSRKAA